MKTEKMNFANLQKLSRKEMKSVMAGLTDNGKKCRSCSNAYDCGSGCDACQTGKNGANGYCYKIKF